MKYVLYFFLGGTVVSLTTWLGSLGRSWLAAFVSTFPALTALTFILIYQNGGVSHTVPYARNLLYFVVPWLAYVYCFIYTVNLFGFWFALAVSIAVFVVVASLLKLLL